MSKKIGSRLREERAAWEEGRFLPDSNNLRPSLDLAMSKMNVLEDVLDYAGGSNLGSGIRNRGLRFWAQESNMYCLQRNREVRKARSRFIDGWNKVYLARRKDTLKMTSSPVTGAAIKRCDVKRHSTITHWLLET
jgi:hypothetical protein